MNALNSATWDLCNIKGCRLNNSFLWTSQIHGFMSEFFRIFAFTCCWHETKQNLEFPPSFPARLWNSGSWRQKQRWICAEVPCFPLLASAGRMQKWWFISMSSPDLKICFKGAFYSCCNKRVELPQLFPVIPAHLALLSGGHLFPIGISSETEWILWTIVSETWFFWVHWESSQGVGATMTDIKH